MQTVKLSTSELQTEYILFAITCVYHYQHMYISFPSNDSSNSNTFFKLSYFLIYNMHTVNTTSNQYHIHFRLKEPITPKLLGALHPSSNHSCRRGLQTIYEKELKRWDLVESSSSLPNRWMTGISYPS
jgi:hypothetical protein